MSTVFNGKILVKDTQTADNNDKIVAISSNGEIKESTITNQQLEDVVNIPPDLSNYVDKTTAQTITGVKTFNNDTIFNFGTKFANAGAGTILNPTNAGILQNTNGRLQFFNTVASGVDAKNWEFDNSNLTAPKRTYGLPDKDDDLATLSDLPTEWSTYSGSRVSADLIVSIGDYDGSGNGTKLEINEDEEEVRIDANSGMRINGNLFSVTAIGTAYYFRTIATATIQSSATLNTSHPVATNPIGTRVFNTVLKEEYLRESGTNWVKFTGTSI